MRYEPPSKQIVYEGSKLDEALDRALRDLWVRQAVLVTDAAAGATPFAGSVATILADRLFDRLGDFSGPVTRSSVMRITHALRSREVDAVVAVGGSALIDTVKAARICLTNNVADEADMERLRLSTTAATPRPYLVAIPSDAGLAPYSMHLDFPREGGEPAMALRHPDLAADVVILLPEATANVGVEDLILGAGDVLAQAMAMRTLEVARPVLAAAEYGQRCLVEGAAALRRADGAAERAAFLGSAWVAAQAAASGLSPPDPDGKYRTQALAALASGSVPLEGDEQPQ